MCPQMYRVQSSTQVPRAVLLCALPMLWALPGPVQHRSTSALLRPWLLSRPRLVLQATSSTINSVGDIEQQKQKADLRVWRRQKRNDVVSKCCGAVVVTAYQALLARRTRLQRLQTTNSHQIAFAGPALSTVLADPLMSVVDALCVGRFCDTLEVRGMLGLSLCLCLRDRQG